MNVCFVGYTFYEGDNRAIRCMRTLAERGDSVDVIALGKKGQPRHEKLQDVTIYRLQNRTRNEKGALSHFLRHLTFFFRSSFLLIRLTCRKRYDLIQVKSVPDFQVFAAWFPKLLGTKIILDIYDVSPEFYLSKFNASTTSLVYKALLWWERAATRFADHVIIANDLWFAKLTQRSVTASKCSSFANYIQSDLFYRHERKRTDDRFIIIYPGVLNWHQGVDIAIRAFAIVKQSIPNAEFHIYGEGDQQPALEKLVQELNLQDSVHIFPPVPFAKVPQLLADADMGVVPKRNDPFGNEAYSTKILEYMSQGLPAVVSATSVDLHYFDDTIVKFFVPGDHAAMAEAMLTLISNPNQRQQQVAAAAIHVHDESWQAKEQYYLQILGELAYRKAPSRS